MHRIGHDFVQTNKGRKMNHGQHYRGNEDSYPGFVQGSQGLLDSSNGPPPVDGAQAPSRRCLILNPDSGTTCYKKLTTENYKRHFERAHRLIKADDGIICQWNGCNMTLASHQRLITHLETHQKFSCNE
ncbi:hypothetical protein GYMLUDRAFT_250487 [Collybiopsis luxurians FD-317 M1]|uniref:Unplaced genomic scaffold GYMLUscaffold_82, whole genome shotgun sequence n=1 Tax=Collybiopsis luxurians FD-317 M1 TaxID=944289 RepID=A0A0D0BUZ6_9AGAR|nr:hypothetical protein GYMLUDRAFT_250487 [Collybiopsis luxurians FD-317 M1]